MGNDKLTPPASDAVRVLLSQDLFKQARMVCIEHAGQRYLLRITKDNKLILTK